MQNCRTNKILNTSKAVYGQRRKLIEILLLLEKDKKRDIVIKWISHLISASAAVQHTPRQASPRSPEIKKYFSNFCWARTTSAMS